MRKVLSIFVFLLVALLLGNISPILLLAKNLVWETEGVIFSDPTIHNVEVILLPDGRYRMYFHQATEMKSAISTDGRAFEVEPGVRLQGAMPSLIKLSDGRWRIYYQTQESGKGVFKSALSTDGLKWNLEPGTRLTGGGEFDLDNVVHPSVIALPQGGYRMYYDGEIKKTEQEFIWRILSAISPDGLTWTKEGGVRIDVETTPLEADLVFNAHARYLTLTGTYELYFGVQTPNDEFIDGIYRATSTDGLLFSDPIAQLTPEEESGEFGVGGQVGSYQDPFVLELDTEKRMYYWIQGSGIYSAVLKEAETKPSGGGEIKGFWERVKALPQDIVSQLPKNLELYIVPAVLLVIGLVAVIYLWRSRLRR